MMPNPYAKLYSISENGEYLGKGTVSELQLWLGVPISDIRKAVKEGRDVNGYEIKFLGRADKSILRRERVVDDTPKRKPQEKEKDIESNLFDFLAYHLKLYGNTSCVKDPVPYLPALYDIGLDCRVKEVMDEEKPVKGGRGRPPKPKMHYYVEVVHETKGQRASI